MRKLKSENQHVTEDDKPSQEIVLQALLAEDGQLFLVHVLNNWPSTSALTEVKAGPQ